MADEQQGKNGWGRLFSRAQKRRRDRAELEKWRARQAAGERAREIFSQRSAQEERSRLMASRRFSYREMGGGYAGYGGTGDRRSFEPEAGRYGAGYSSYGPMRQQQHGGSWQPGDEFDYRAEPLRQRSAPFRGGGRHDAAEARLGAERVGPGAFRRWRGGGAMIAGGEPGRSWEGRSDAERTGAWYGGPAGQRRGWTGSGPGSEHTGDWFGGAGSAREEPASTWYGGGLHEARDDRGPRDFGRQGGPDHGRFGRESIPDRGGGRGFGGPLGRHGDRAAGEQGRLYGGQYRGREDEFPIAGEAIAGRGHIGSGDYRDLTLFGEGSGDRGSEERYRERHEEGEHYRGP